jgi:hypothetical protein
MDLRDAKITGDVTGIFTSHRSGKTIAGASLS